MTFNYTELLNGYNWSFIHLFIKASLFVLLVLAFIHSSHTLLNKYHHKYLKYTVFIVSTLIWRFDVEIYIVCNE